MDILNEYRENDSRIRVMQHLEKTDGAAAARNMGMDAATGEYLSFLDADDFFEPDMLEKAYVRAREDDSDVVLFDAYVYDEISKRNYKEKWILDHNNLPGKSCFKPEECRDTIFRITPGAAWSGIFRRKMVTDNHIRFESICTTDDVVFVYLSYCSANHISIVNERLLHYRRNVKGSQISNASRHPEGGYMAPLVLKHKLEEKGIYDTYKKSLAVFELELGSWHMYRMSNVVNFSTLFYALKDRYLEELNTLELDEHDVGRKLIEWRDSVRSDSMEEYLIKRQIMNNAEEYMSNIPTDMEEGASVVIYGAGEFGRKLFSKILEEKLFPITAWVDRNYSEIGFPIQPVDTILKVPYDYILVAMRHERVYTSIRNDLIAMGVDAAKIIWIN
jgi:glycosyltransferase involved in cell wall biosynthesis